jgi:hypothetical protein
MKRGLSLIILLFISTILLAQVSKTVNCTAGALSSLLTAAEKSTITDLTITGTIDARDFKTMRDNISNLSVLNISGVTISSYTGTQGTYGTSSRTYPANTIPEYAFYNSSMARGKTSLDTVYNPITLTTVGKYAFECCLNLKSVTIPSSVTTIDAFGFFSCKSLVTIAFPNSLRTIGLDAFRYCSGLNAVFIPSGVTSIATTAFNQSNAVVNVDASNASYSSSDGVLLNKNKTRLLYCPASKTGSYTIPSSVNIISMNAFEGCAGITEISFPVSVNSIEGQAFSGCTSLTTVSLPSALTAVQWAIFENCSKLESVTLPVGITYLGPNAFSSCSRLSSISIPSTVETIGEETFSGCTSIDTIFIPSSVSLMGEMGLGKSPFLGCSAYLKVDESNPQYSSVDGVLFNKTKTELIQCPTSKTGNYSIPETVTSLGNYSFENGGLLDSVFISDAVLTIGESAFLGNSAIIIVDAGNPNYSGEGGVLFDKTKTELIQCPVSKTGDYSIPVTVSSLGRQAFNYCDKLSSIAVPTALTGYINDSFYGCTGSINVNSGNPNYSSSEGVLFNKAKTELIHCPGSKVGSYTVPTSVTTFGYHAFANCHQLSSLTIPESVTVVWNTTFENTTGLISLTVNPTIPPKSYGMYDLYKFDESNCTLYVPSGLKRIYQLTDVWLSFEHIIDGEGFWLSKDSCYFTSDVIDSDTIIIHSNTTWNFSCTEPWLTITPETGSDNDTIIIRAEVNPSASSRTANITVSATGSESQIIFATQEEGPGSSITENVAVLDTIIFGITCFNAYDTITVAGDGSSVEFQTGSSVELIAGQSIFLLPGFHALEGSVAHAWITTDSTFCDGASGSIVQSPQVEKSGDAGIDFAIGKVYGNELKVYPNPNSGRFTIELLKVKAEVKAEAKVEIKAEVKVYNALGERVYQTEMQDRQSTIDLSGIRRGLYVVMVTDGQERFMRKVMVE